MNFFGISFRKNLSGVKTLIFKCLSFIFWGTLFCVRVAGFLLCRAYFFYLELAASKVSHKKSLQHRALRALGSL